jgi:hypothetical protein
MYICVQETRCKVEFYHIILSNFFGSKAAYLWNTIMLSHPRRLSTHVLAKYARVLCEFFCLLTRLARALPQDVSNAEMRS